MDLPASCGSRRSGPAGLEPATRFRSKHQVRRIASGAGTLLRLAGRRFTAGRLSQPQPTNPPTPSLGRPHTIISLLFDRWEGSVLCPSPHWTGVSGDLPAIRDWSGGGAHVSAPRPGSRAATCCISSPLAERRQMCSHPSDWLRGGHARIWSEIQDANVQRSPAWHIGLRPRTCRHARVQWPMVRKRRWVWLLLKL